MKTALHIVSVFLLLAFLACTTAYSRVLDRENNVVYVTENTNIQKQLSKGGTTYVIKCNIDLKGQTIQIPASSELRFQSSKIYNGSIKLSNHSKIEGNGVVFITHPHQQMIVANGVDDVEISGINFNCVGNKHSSYESAGVFITNSNCIKIHDCFFGGDSAGSSGYMGLAMLKVGHVEIFKNDFRYFYKPDFWKSNHRNTAWATYLVSLKDATIYQNTFNKTYSGIKLTGYIENVKICSNKTFDNITDGCDFAGISAKNVIIENNNFENCGDCGIEFKILFLDQWHKDKMKKYYGYNLKTPRFFKDITIRNNIITSWVGLKVWNQYNKTMDLSKKIRNLGYDKKSGNIVLSNNRLTKTTKGSGNPNSSVGIQVAYNSVNTGDFIIENNKMDGYKFGLYFVNSSTIDVRGNYVKSLTYSVYERFEQNKELNQTWNHNICIDNNTFYNTSDHAIVLSDRTKDWTISNNAIHVLSTKKMVEDQGNHNKMSNNSLIKN